MAKITPISKQHYSPEICLKEAIDNLDDMKAVMICHITKTDGIRFSHSSVDLSELALLTKAVETYTYTRILDAT